jgi:hypothetical protein
MIGKILEITFVLVLAYLVIANASNFSIAIRSIGSVYTGAVKTLQGR